MQVFKKEICYNSSSGGIRICKQLVMEVLGTSTDMILYGVWNPIAAFWYGIMPMYFH